MGVVVRTQIQLKEEQARRLRKLARCEGVSLAEIIRRCVDHALDDQASRRGELYERAAAVVGRYRDREGADDLAAEHDRYLDRAIE